MKIKELFSGPEKWTKRAYARTQDGAVAPCDSAGAVRWCLVGALEKCYPDHADKRTARAAIHAAIKKGTIPEWNDAPGRTFAEVKELVEKLDI